MTARIDEQELAVGRLYADAALRLAHEQGREQEVLAELNALVELLDHDPRIERLFISPLVDFDLKRQTLERAFRGQLSDLLTDTLQVMNRKGRLGLLRALKEAYRMELDKANGIVEVDVTTAVPMSAEMRRQTEEVAGRLAGANARLNEFVEGSLLGGMIIKIGDRKIDTSASKELETMRAQLLERTSKELLSGKSYLSEE